MNCVWREKSALIKMYEKVSNNVGGVKTRLIWYPSCLLTSMNFFSTISILEYKFNIWFHCFCFLCCENDLFFNDLQILSHEKSLWMQSQYLICHVNTINVYNIKVWYRIKKKLESSSLLLLRQALIVYLTLSKEMEDIFKN